MTTRYSLIFLLLCGLVVVRGILSEEILNHEKVCSGTSNEFSTPTLEGDDVYQSLKEQFEGCTYVEGNVEITFLRHPDYNMSFLNDIREVTGYVLILLLFPEVVTFPNLSVIRGMELYEGNLALYVLKTYHYRLNGTGMRELQFPKLHEILKGEVKFQDNRDLCYVQTIDWGDMREGLVPTFIDHGSSCTADQVCAPNCPSGCWGKDPSMCQELTHKDCSGTCDYRCKGPTQADCCHRSCAAGCTGPSNHECLACRRFTIDDQCVETCPARTIYNPETFQNEPNPDFRHAYGRRCLTSCPSNVVEEGDNCVNECPQGTVESRVPGENKCVECDGPCPKVCDGSTDVIYREDFDNGLLTNCTIIRNNIFIGTSSFEGDIFLGMHGVTMELLERLSTVQEIKGFVTVQGHATHFTNLTFLRNLKKIYGRQLYGIDRPKQFSLFINTNSIRSLGLTSLQRINKGDVLFYDTPKLCYAAEGMWDNIFKQPDRQSVEFYPLKDPQSCILHSTLQSLNLVSLEMVEHGNINFKSNAKLCYVKMAMFTDLIHQDTEVTITQNANEEKCVAEGHVCDPQCAPIGCWGPGPKQCARCLNAQIGDTCIQECNTLSHTRDRISSQDSRYRDKVSSKYVVSEGSGDNPTICAHCDAECRGMCRGPGPQNCTECIHVKDGPFCRAECPVSKYQDEKDQCQVCHSNCNMEVGCTGPANKVGDGGCNACYQVRVKEDGMTVLECMQDGEPCGINSFSFHISLSSKLPLSGYSLCQDCDSNCLGCFGAGPSKCKECEKYKRGFECVDKCGTNQFHDENNTCRDCHLQCRECWGGSHYDCLKCQNFEVLESKKVTFCSSECPADYPYDDRKSHCVANCSENQFADKKSSQCVACHQQCLGGCFDDRRSSCFECRNVKHDSECLEKCPAGYKNDSGICMRDPNMGSTN